MQNSVVTFCIVCILFLLTSYHSIEASGKQLKQLYFTILFGSSFANMYIMQYLSCGILFLYSMLLTTMGKHWRMLKLDTGAQHRSAAPVIAMHSDLANSNNM